MAAREGGNTTSGDANRGKGAKKDDANDDILEDDNVYEVEKIVGMNKVDGKVMYRVRWLGYSAQFDTWEPYDNLLTCKDLVEEYLNEKDSKKKRKQTPEKNVKKKRQTLVKQKDEVDPGIKQEEMEVPVELEMEPSNPVVTVKEEGSPNSQTKDTFWKDFEEGKINLFEGDMYSKVKERSSTRTTSQSSDEQKKHKSKGKKTLESTEKSEGKSRRRIKVQSENSDDNSEADGSQRQTSQETMETSEDSSSSTLATSEVQPMEVDNVQEKVDLANKNRSKQNLLKPAVTQTQQTPSRSGTETQTKVLLEKKQNNENNVLPVRRPQVPLEDTVNNNNTSTTNKNNAPRVEPNEIQFEFSKYNPEEWIRKEAYNLNQVVELNNADFRAAVKAGDYDILRKAVNGKTTYNMELADSSGTTLLMISAMSGFDDIVELLVMRGANVNATQKNGCTALMLAADYGHVCPVAVLLGLGAHIDVQQISGETALMKACRRGHRQVVQLLLEYGANFAMVTNGDTTALKLAKMYDHSGIETLLIDHISRVTASFESQVFVTLNNTAAIQHALFPIHCFSLNEGSVFKVNFNHQLQPPQPGVGMLLFIAHARMSSQETKCRLYGPCAVSSVQLNGTKLLPLTEDGNFVLSFLPLVNGKNELVINTVPTLISKSKLIVCAYKAQLNTQRS